MLFLRGFSAHPETTRNIVCRGSVSGESPVTIIAFGRWSDWSDRSDRFPPVPPKLQQLRFNMLQQLWLRHFNRFPHISSHVDSLCICSETSKCIYINVCKEYPFITCLHTSRSSLVRLLQFLPCAQTRSGHRWPGLNLYEPGTRMRWSPRKSGPSQPGRNHKMQGAKKWKFCRKRWENIEKTMLPILIFHTSSHHPLLGIFLAVLWLLA